MLKRVKRVNIMTHRWKEPSQNELSMKLGHWSIETGLVLNKQEWNINARSEHTKRNFVSISNFF